MFSGTHDDSGASLVIFNQNQAAGLDGLDFVDYSVFCIKILGLTRSIAVACSLLGIRLLCSEQYFQVLAAQYMQIALSLKHLAILCSPRKLLSPPH